MMAWVICALIVLVLLGLGARWLFRQRSPDEMRAAVEWARARRERKSKAREPEN